ncbi:hypothetical protein BDAP_001226 [Binucleata daphniae]
MLYNTSINARIKQKDDNEYNTNNGSFVELRSKLKENTEQYNTNNDSFVELRSKLKENTEQYKHCATLYGELVKKFIDEYEIERRFVDDNFEMFRCEFILQNQYEINKFRSSCQEYIQEYYKNHKISENEKKFFEYYCRIAT